MQNSDCKYIVYKHTFPNDKIYIGITQCKPGRRWDYGRGYKRQRIVSCAIKKYGWDNIKHEILYEGLSKENAELIEIKLIAQYKCNDRMYGYNTFQGGSCNYTFKMSDETKSRISKTLTGKPHSKEHIEKVAQKNRRPILQYDLNGDFIKRYNSAVQIEEELGIEHSHISQCCNGHRHSSNNYYWKFESDKTDIHDIIKLKREAHIESLKNHNIKPRKISQYDLHGNLLGEWETMSDACRYYGFKHSCLSLCCSGKRSTSYGFIWKYKE